MPKAIKKEVKPTTKKAAVKTTRKPAAKKTVKAPAKVVRRSEGGTKKVAPPKAPKLKVKDKAAKLLIETIVDGMQDVKGKNITILDLTKLPNAVTDYFVIATGDSSTQVESMASAVVRKTRKELKEKPWHEEGVGNSEWILLDYINVVVHIFYRETREFYNLEDLWLDADRTDIPNLD